MIALREGANQLNHEHFHSGIAEGISHLSHVCSRIMLTRIRPTVQSKKKNDLMYFA